LEQIQPLRENIEAVLLLYYLFLHICFGFFLSEMKFKSSMTIGSCHCSLFSYSVLILIAEDLPAPGSVASGWTELGRKGTSPHSKVAFDEPPFRRERSPDSLSHFQCRQQVDEIFHYMVLSRSGIEAPILKNSFGQRCF
jgi:hypothetical protein